MIEITRADNGYIITEYLKGEGDEVNQTVLVEDDERDSSSFTTQKLFWALQELMGLYGSKHDKFRCWVEVRNQDGEVVNE